MIGVDGVLSSKVRGVLIVLAKVMGKEDRPWGSTQGVLSRAKEGELGRLPRGAFL